MKTLVGTLLFSFLIANLEFSAQSNFKEALKRANPVDPKLNLPIEEIIKIHESYLDKAINAKNDTAQLFGQLFLFVDCYKSQDYVSMNEHLLQAENLVNKPTLAQWKGPVSMRRALVHGMKEEYDLALKQYEAAVQLCFAAHDTVCAVESLEQVANGYYELAKYEEAHKAYETVFPLIRKFADSTEVALAFNNYSNLLSAEGRLAEAINYLDSAIIIAHQQNNTYKEMMYMNNKAYIYSEMGAFDKALDLYKSCEVINIKGNWSDRLIQNYLGMSVAYEEKGDYHNAFDFLKKFYLLKDSLNGLEVQNKIAELEATNGVQQKTIALEESELKLLKAHELLHWRKLFIAGLIALVLAGFVIWRLQARRKKNELALNKQNLDDLTNILIQKNAQLAELDEKVTHISVGKIQAEDAADFDKSVFNERILTKEDWAAFKTRFEKAYPGYMIRLRETHSSLSDAEERLFLFIKLKLRSSEIASILGISADSVKKARSRLRKKLELTEDINLESYILEL